MQAVTERGQDTAGGAKAHRPTESVMVPDGFALVPLRMTSAMREVTDSEGWAWEDLLAAASAITEEQYQQIASKAGAVDVEEMAHSALQEALSCGVSHDVFVRFGTEVARNCAASMAAEILDDKAVRKAAMRSAGAKWVTSFLKSNARYPTGLQCYDAGVLAAASEAWGDAGPRLAVWFGSMPESNGRINWTAMLYRADGQMMDGITISRSEYKDRVRYDADCMRFLIGEIASQPFILDYDGDLREGSAEPDIVETPVKALKEVLANILKCDADARRAKDNPRANLNGVGLVDLFDHVGHPFGAGKHQQAPYRSCELEGALSDAHLLVFGTPYEERPQISMPGQEASMEGTEQADTLELMDLALKGVSSTQWRWVLFEGLNGPRWMPARRIEGDQQEIHWEAVGWRTPNVLALGQVIDGPNVDFSPRLNHVFPR